MVTYILLASGILFLIARYLRNRNSNVKSMSGSDALVLHKTNEVTFIDVRTPKETAQGKLSGAIEANVTSSSFINDIAHLDKNLPYVVYCRSGMRSARACQIMEKQGFVDLTNVSGGYIGMNK